MKFTKHISSKATPQSVPIPGSGQIPNSAGGFAWAMEPWALVDRFLILGTEGGTYYISEQKLTRDHAANLLERIREDGRRVLSRVVEVSQSGRAPKNDAAIFALALCASFGDTETRQAAFEALPRVCRIGTHLFQFIAECEELRGWGRGLRKAVARWYSNMPADELTYQAIKYQQRGGWSHRDLLRLAHPVPPTDEHKALFKWIVDDELAGHNPRLEAFHELIRCEDPKRAAEMIRENRMPRECVPTNLLSEPEVWDALLEDMPLTAMIRNLANMTRAGLLTPGSKATKQVIEKLNSGARLKQARVHPIALLLAHATYASGHGLRGQHAWTPVPRIVDALDDAFYLAFDSVERTGKRYLVGVDVSGSMSQWTVAGTPLSACEAATAMAMVTMATEESVTPMAFADEFRKLRLSPKMRLKDALRHTQDQNFGGTDCALPMLFAAQQGLEVDVFVVLTDNETWAGRIHPSQALQQYRQKTGIPAKLIVAGMCSNGFTIADPKDPRMLDIVGFDASAPQAMREFALV
jgi:60 kDa SS-A/Ro ribonucleoprotein